MSQGGRPLAPLLGDTITVRTVASPWIDSSETQRAGYQVGQSRTSRSFHPRSCLRPVFDTSRPPIHSGLLSVFRPISIGAEFQCFLGYFYPSSNDLQAGHSPS